MAEAIWRWSATTAEGWSQEPIEDLLARPIVAELLAELSHWTNYVDPAFVIWLRDGRLLACVSDLALPGRDRAGRPARARCLVVTDKRHIPEVLGQLAGLIRNGLPPGFIVSDAGADHGFRVSAQALPGPAASPVRPPSGLLKAGKSPAAKGAWPPPGRQQWLPDVAAAGDWLQVAASAPEVILRQGGGAVAIGSPLLADSTVHLASDYALVAGPGLHQQEVVRSPKGQTKHRSANLPVAGRRPHSLPVAPILAILVGLAVLTLLLL